MIDYIQSTIHTYNKTAEEYTEKVEGLHHNEEGIRFLDYLPENSKILDLGCGSGRDAKIFSEKGYNVVGVDLSEGMLEQAVKMCPSSEFKKMDIRCLDYPDEFFEGVWAVASILHLPKSDVPQSLSESYRVLKLKGVMYICVKQGEGEELKLDNRYGPDAVKFYSYFQPEELNRILEDIGFEILETKIHKWNNDYIKHPEIRIFAQKN